MCCENQNRKAISEDIDRLSGYADDLNFAWRGGELRAVVQHMRAIENVLRSVKAQVKEDLYNELL